MTSQRPWAASDATDDEEGVVRLFTEKDTLIAELTPEQARALATELNDVASYVDAPEVPKPPTRTLTEGPRSIKAPNQKWRVLTTISGKHEERYYDTQAERDKEALDLSIANNADVILEFWDYSNTQDALNLGWACDWVYRAGGVPA